MPAAFMASHHWSVSSSFRSKIFGSSFPLPHSIRVNVLGPMWMKAMNSFFRAFNWFGVGTTCAAFSMICSGVSVSSILIVLLHSMVFSATGVEHDAKAMQAIPSPQSQFFEVRFKVVFIQFKNE